MLFGLEELSSYETDKENLPCSGNGRVTSLWQAMK